MQLTSLLALVFAGWGVKAVVVTPQKAKFDWETTKYVYAFGDSYSFVQGTEGLANFRYVVR